MPPGNPADDPFAKLAQNLGELEVTIGERARPAVAAVRAGLRDAVAMRERGDIPGSLAAIGHAMERLAALLGTLDADEGVMMRAVAERFAAALGTGRKGAAKTIVNVMRHKAGDLSDDDNQDW